MRLRRRRLRGGGGHALEEAGWAAGHPVTAGTRSHSGGRGLGLSGPLSGRPAAAALAAPGALSKVLGVCQVDQVRVLHAACL